MPTNPGESERPPAVLKKMAIAYLVSHALIALCLLLAKQAFSLQEHLTAINWAIPSLALCWISLRLLIPAYRASWLQDAFKIPFLGGYFVGLFLAVPLSLVAALLIVIASRPGESSLWILCTFVGVIVAMFIGHSAYLSHYGDE